MMKSKKNEITEEERKEKTKKSNNKEKETTEEKIETPKGFTKRQELNKKEYGYHNGRKYLKLKNGFGMWADNGQSFSINDLD